MGIPLTLVHVWGQTQQGLHEHRSPGSIQAQELLQGGPQPTGSSLSPCPDDSPLQVLSSQVRVKPAGQEQKKRPGTLWQEWEQGLGPSVHSSLSAEGQSCRPGSGTLLPAHGDRAGVPTPGRGAAHPHKTLLWGPARSLQGTPPHAPLQGKGAGSKDTVARIRASFSPGCVCQQAGATGWADSGKTTEVQSGGNKDPMGATNGGHRGQARGQPQWGWVAQMKVAAGTVAGDRALESGRRCHHFSHAENSHPSVGDKELRWGFRGHPVGPAPPICGAMGTPRLGTRTQPSRSPS